MAAKTPNTGEPSPLQKECNVQVDRVLTGLAESLVSGGRAGVSMTVILDGSIRLAFAEGVNAALGMMHRGYGLTHVQDMLIGVYQDTRDRSSRVVHAVAVLGTSTDPAAIGAQHDSEGAGVVVSSPPPDGAPTRDDLLFGVRAAVRANAEATLGSDSVRLALNVAHDAHRGQTDKHGRPYIEHVERVAKIVEPLGSLCVCVALLHDVLEDTTVTRDMLRSLGFGIRVVEAVEILTRHVDKHAHAGMADESYTEYIERVVRSGDPVAQAVKHADLLDHVRPGAGVPELRPRYIRALRRLDPVVRPMYQPGEAMLADDVHAEVYGTRQSER